jgi:adenosylcobinamide-GDP ribazoletransferase
MLLKSLRALLQFTTILPLGATAEFRCFARRSWLYPVAGYVTGGIAGLAVFWIASPLLAAGVAIAVLFLITGANHFDGLLDLGDGLMAQGDRERRIQALTDRQTGTGGIALGTGVTLIAFAALAGSPAIWAAVIAAEVCAKFSMAFLTAYGAPFREGMHSFLYGEAKPWYPAAAALLCLPLLLLPLPPIRLAGAAIVMVITPLVLLILARRIFGGVNGDVVGASSEITRALVLAMLIIIPVTAPF